jgi:hypothetical protein
LVYHHHFEEKTSDLEGMDEADFFVAVCETCDRVLLYYKCKALHEYYGSEFEDFDTASLVWPSEGNLPEDVPETIRRCYQEALRVKMASPTAFALLIRRALEALCEDRKAAPGNLQRRLQDLAFKGEIPSALAEAVDVIRVLGNLSAHTPDQHLGESDAFRMDDLFRAILEYVYIAPSKLQKLRSTLQKVTTIESAGEKASERPPRAENPKPTVH